MKLDEVVGKRSVENQLDLLCERSLVATRARKRLSGMAIYGFPIYSHPSYFSCSVSMILILFVELLWFGDF